MRGSFGALQCGVFAGEQNEVSVTRQKDETSVVLPLPVEAGTHLVLALSLPPSRVIDEVDIVLLRTLASYIGLALSNVQLYAQERSRRSRAESLERVVRMLRDTQTIEEVLLVFAATVSHEVKMTCAAYELDRTQAVRRAFRPVEGVRAGFPERIDVAPLLPLLDREDITASPAIPAGVRDALFGSADGIIISLRIDGVLWGLLVFAAPVTTDWNEPERRLYFQTVASHLELAIAGARGFERIQQLARALSESNEFKDDLLAMLAHDFKGPLTVILGYCELLLENPPEQVRDELETVYSQTQRLVRLSEDAVALAQTQAAGFALDRATLDLRDVLSESVKAHNRGHSRISLAVPDAPVPVNLDSARFNHVMDNLLMNALKYSDAPIAVRLTATGSAATIEVADRGIGIPESEITSVFARFGRASNARRKGIAGSGVGLYVSRKIVEVHGGSIAVQSREAQGSTFTVTLPLTRVHQA